MNSQKLSPGLDAILQRGVLDRLPVTFSGFWFEQIRNWDLLFPAEQDYHERLLSLFDRSDPESLARLFSPLREIEKRMGVNERTWPRRQFTLDQVDFLNRNPFYPQWRAAISNLFAQIDPVLDEQVVQRRRPRLAIILAPAELPADPGRMWTRIREHGRMLAVQTPDDPSDYLALLLTGGARSAGAASLADLCAAAAPDSAYAAWVVEAGDAIGRIGSGHEKVIRFPYAGLETYRKRLMREVDRVVREEQLKGPRELGARLKELKITAEENSLAHDAALAEFLRATLLSGNGTLLLNNTFVQWASIQAIRRARPRLLVTGFGIRNKIKPFSSLLIYADQEKVSPIPTQKDMLGSYVDLEVLYQYVWAEFGKYAEYRDNTVCCFAADGMDQVLVTAPPQFLGALPAGPLPLAALHRTMKEWIA